MAIPKIIVYAIDDTAVNFVFSGKRVETYSDLCEKVANVFGKELSAVDISFFVSQDRIGRLAPSEWDAGSYLDFLTDDDALSIWVHFESKPEEARRPARKTKQVKPAEQPIASTNKRQRKANKPLEESTRASVEQPIPNTRKRQRKISEALKNRTRAPSHTSHAGSLELGTNHDNVARLFTSNTFRDVEGTVYDNSHAPETIREMPGVAQGLFEIKSVPPKIWNRGILVGYVRAEHCISEFQRPLAIGVFRESDRRIQFKTTGAYAYASASAKTIGSPTAMVHVPVHLVEFIARFAAYPDNERLAAISDAMGYTRSVDEEEEEEEEEQQEQEDQQEQDISEEGNIADEHAGPKTSQNNRAADRQAPTEQKNSSTKKERSGRLRKLNLSESLKREEKGDEWELSSI